jgi:hypothetical protein
MLALFITRYWLSHLECCSFESIFKTSRMSFVLGVRFIKLRLLKMKDTLCSGSRPALSPLNLQASQPLRSYLLLWLLLPTHLVHLADSNNNSNSNSKKPTKAPLLKEHKQ